MAGAAAGLAVQATFVLLAERTDLVVLGGDP
jgi:hypothetical protein